MMPEEAIAMSELVRVASSKAKIVIVSANWLNCLLYKLYWFKRKDNPHECMRAYTKRSFTKLAQRSGLVDAKVCYIKQPFHKMMDVQLVAIKP